MKTHIFLDFLRRGLLALRFSLAGFTRKFQYRPILLAGLLMAAGLGSLFGYGQTAASQRGLQATKASSASTLQPGPYYALVIGNNNYRYVGKLKTAVNDADAVAQLLHERYGFLTKVLHDATRNEILTALNEYRRSLPENSNLVIYYAGHGYKDAGADEAYWLPVDAQKDNNQNWISADDITADARAIPAMHLLIISDSCYSGALADKERGATVSIDSRERGAYLAQLMQSKSRTLMASGRNEPVSDGGPGHHSVFAAAVLESLRRIDNDKFTAAELFQQFVQPAVAGKSSQVPQYAVIRESGHQYGDFVFTRVPSKHQAGSEAPMADSSRQRYPIVHYGGSDARMTCLGWMTIDNHVIRFRGELETHGIHSFDFPFDSIKEVKQNTQADSTNHAFQIRLKNGAVYNFSLYDIQSGAYLSPDQLLNKIRNELQK
jgi:hypothetical protein